MNLDALRADVLEIARAHQTSHRTFRPTLPAKVASVMVRYLGAVDVRELSDSGSAYLYVFGLKVRISNHQKGRRYCDVEVKLGIRGDEEGSQHAASQAVKAMAQLMEAKSRHDAGWVRHG